jgi:hypothetical protein
MTQVEKIQVVKDMKLDTDTKLQILVDIHGLVDLGIDDEPAQAPLTPTEFRDKWGDLIADAYRVGEAK